MTVVVKLPNRITSVCATQPGSGKVSIHISIGYGSGHETLDEHGLISLTQEATQGGTKTRTREDIADAIESGGGQLGSYTTRERTVFEVECLTNETARIFETVADVLLNPTFEEDEIQQTKEMVSEIIDQQDQKPSTLAGKKFREAAFGSQSAAHDPMGTKDAVASFTREQIVSCYSRMMSDPSRIIVSFAGDITPEQAEDLTRIHFGHITGSAQPSLPPAHFTGGDIRVEQENNQLNLLIGFKAPSRNSDERFALYLLEDQLAGGMSAPLFQEIREKRSLVYSVSASYIPLHTDGLFYIRAGTGKGNAGELTKAAFDLLGDMAKRTYSAEDLAMSQERILRQQKGALETSSAIARRNAQQLADFGRIVPLAEFEENLKNVTSDNIRRACAAMIADGAYALAAVGPMDSLPQQEQIVAALRGQVEELRIPAADYIRAPEMKSGIESGNGGKGMPRLTKLENGMIVVSIERPGTLSCGAWVGAGSAHEPAHLNGATHMNEHMMFKGTPKYGPGTIDRIVEMELCAKLNAYTSKDMTSYYFYNLALKDLPKVVDICGEMVFKADISESEYAGVNGGKGERDVVIEEIKMYNDDIGSRNGYLMDRLSYPNQSQGRPILGTEEALRAISADMLRAYRDEYYSCDNVVFSAAGPIAHEDFVKLIAKNFGHMKPNKTKPFPSADYCGGVAHEEMQTALLSKISIRMPAVASTNPDIFAFEALGDILGGGTSSRLHKEIVNNLGLTSGISASAIDYTHCGWFGIFANAQAENLKPLLRAVHEELRKIPSTVTGDDLTKAKTSMKMALLCSTETNQDNCDFYGRMTLHFRKLVTPEEMIAKIDALTTQDIARAAELLLSFPPTVAMTVPPGTDPAYIPTHEDVISWRSAAQKAPIVRNLKLE